MAVDPGNTTGVAVGYVTLYPTLKETLASLIRRRALEIDGGWQEQVEKLVELASRFSYKAHTELRMPIERVHLVIEDFVLRMPARTTNLTSIWVAAPLAYQSRGIFGDVTWQQPSSAKTIGSDDRLRAWGLWERGSAHKRDGWRHFALRVNGLLQGR